MFFSFFACSDAQLVMVYNYVHYWFLDVVAQFIIQNFAPYGVQTLSDLGYLQWGQAAVTPNGESVYVLNPAIGAPFEFAIYAEGFNSRQVSFTLFEVFRFFF